MKLWLSPLVLMASGPLSLLSPSDVASLRKGEVVARVLEPADGAEVVTLSAVRVRADPEAFRVCVADPTCLFGYDDLLGAGRVGAMASGDDLPGLDLDPGDREHLERCRVGRCRVRLSGEAIQHFQEVGWKRPDAPAHADALFRTTLATLARRYAEGGDASLVTYEDGARGDAVADALDQLLSRPFPLLDLVPPLRARLEDTTAPSRKDLDYVCWRKERFWRQGLISLDHVLAHETASGELVVAVKQLYASHYFDGAIVTFALIRDPGGEGGVLLHMSRARVDIRPSGFTWLERVLLNRMVRGRLRRHLTVLRGRLQGPSGPLHAAKDPPQTE